MKKRLLSLFLIFSLLLIPILGYAATPYTMGWSVGAKDYQLNSKYCTNSKGAVASGTGINFTGGGTVTYEFYLPFHSHQVEFAYSGAGNATITLDTGVQTYSTVLDESDGTKIVNFGDTLGYADQEYTYLGGTNVAIREYVERKGERVFTLTASAAVNITSVTFEKEKSPIPTATFSLCDLPANEVAIQTAVMIDRNASMIMVNGGRRYINVENAKEKPLELNGKLYLPLSTLARAFGYYYEEMSDKNFALLRKDPYEFIFKNGSCWIQKNHGDYEQIQNLLVYWEGRAFLPVRYFAEVLGKTVGYRDGIAVIDDKYSVANILTESTVFSYVKNKFSPFYAEEKTSKTYYVAQTANASDDNNGSIFAPFKTLNKAGAVAQAGDTVIVREGVYRETFTPSNDGTPSNPIVFQAAEGEKVVISSNEKLDSFASYQNNIYISGMDWDLGDGRNQIFINGKSLIEARYPNGPSLTSGENDSPKLSNMWPIRGDMRVPIGNNTVVESDTLLDQENNYWQGGYYCGLFGYGYALATAKIDSSEKGKLHVSNGSTKWWWDHKATDTWNFGYIVGHMNCLDAPGEWILDDGTLYMIFPEGVDPQTVQVEAKKRQLVVDIADRKYIQIEGISTIGGGVRMNNSEMCTLNGMDMHYISHYTYGVDQREGFIDAPYNIANPSGAPPRGEMGIYVGGTDNILVNNKIDHSAASGIYGVGLYTYIENNILNDCGYMASYVSGINFNTEAWKTKNTPRGGYAVYNNTVYNCGRSCWNVSINQNWGLVPYIPYEVAYNDFHDGILCSLDTGITYEYFSLQGHDKLQSKMHHNLIYYTVESKDANPFSSGIYHDGGTQGIETYNNLVFTTQPDSHFSMYNIFVQPLAIAVANHDVWNNATLGVVAGGPDALQVDHYPNEQPFFAGAKSGSEPYLVNYNRFEQNDTRRYTANNAIPSSGVVLKEGLAVYSDNDQYICFEDVDFGEVSNTIDLIFTGDKYHTGDVVEFVIGEDIASGKIYQRTLTATSPYLDQSNKFQTTVNLTSGVHNVYVKMKDYRSAKLSSISVYPKNIDTTMSAKAYGGTFDSYDRTEVVGNADFPPKANYNVKGDADNPMVNNTWPGTVLEYKEVNLLEDSNTLVIAAGSGGQYAGQPIEVRIGSPTATAIAKYYVNKTLWYDYTPVEVPLNETLKAGTYNIYLVFTKELGNAKTSNLYYYGFRKIGQEVGSN